MPTGRTPRLPDWIPVALCDLAAISNQVKGATYTGRCCTLGYRASYNETSTACSAFPTIHCRGQHRGTGFDFHRTNRDCNYYLTP